MLTIVAVLSITIHRFVHMLDLSVWPVQGRWCHNTKQYENGMISFHRVELIREMVCRIITSALCLWIFVWMTKMFGVLFRAPFCSTNLDADVEHGQAQLVLNGVHGFLALKKLFAFRGVVLTWTLGGFCCAAERWCLFLFSEQGAVCSLRLVVARKLWFLLLPVILLMYFLSHWCVCLSELMCVTPPKVVFAPCCLHPSNICGMFCVLGCQGVSPTKCSSPFPWMPAKPTLLFPVEKNGTW